MKKSLNKTLIEKTASALIEEIGLEAFSLRKLASRLSCEPMSLYNYFKNKAELMDALVDSLIEEFEFPDNSLDGRQKIRFMANSWRKIAKRHPHFFPFFALHRLNSDKGAAFLNRVLMVLHEVGFSNEEAARYFRVMNYYLIGAALDEISGYSQGTSALEPVTEQQIQERYPVLADAGVFFKEDQFEPTFEHGLRILLGEHLPIALTSFSTDK